MERINLERRLHHVHGERQPLQIERIPLLRRNIIPTQSKSAGLRKMLQPVIARIKWIVMLSFLKLK